MKKSLILPQLQKSEHCYDSQTEQKHPFLSQRPSSILVFGDSHSIIWEGKNLSHEAIQSKFSNVKVFHLGPALAFNLINLRNDGLGTWGNQIFSILDARTIPAPTAIMLCFGEIDIRTQVIKRAADAHVSIESAVRKIVNRLSNFSERLFDLTKIPILLWEPVATSGIKDFTYNVQFPATGSEIERNVATMLFSDISRELCEISRAKGMSIYSFGIAKHLMNFYETKPEFFEDGCHLNTNGLALGVASLQELCSSNKLPPLSMIFEQFNATTGHTHTRNIAAHVQLTLSSEYSSPSALTNANNLWCFHTNKDAIPFAFIDIGYAALIRNLLIFNRFDACQERASTLQIFAGLNQDTLVEVFGSQKTWREYEKPLAIEIPIDFGPIRFIYLRLTISEFFHLGEVQIFEDTFLTE